MVRYFFGNNSDKRGDSVCNESNFVSVSTYPNTSLVPQQRQELPQQPTSVSTTSIPLRKLDVFRKQAHALGHPSKHLLQDNINTATTALSLSPSFPLGQVQVEAYYTSAHSTSLVFLCLFSGRSLVNCPATSTHIRLGSSLQLQRRRLDGSLQRDALRCLLSCWACWPLQYIQ
jgi:hypothetical protein